MAARAKTAKAKCKAQCAVASKKFNPFKQPLGHPHLTIVFSQLIPPGAQPTTPTTTTPKMLMLLLLMMMMMMMMMMMIGSRPLFSLDRPPLSRVLADLAARLRAQRRWCLRESSVTGGCWRRVFGWCVI